MALSMGSYRHSVACCRLLAVSSPSGLGRSPAPRPQSCPGSAAAPAQYCPPSARFYSSEGGGQRPLARRIVVVGIPNPFIWCRTRIYYFLIRTYFDREFSIEEFKDGAKQAFALVSKLLSECKFDALEELVAHEALQTLKEKCILLPDNHKTALAAAADEIIYTVAGDIGIFYDENGRKFVRILMRFWYLTSANLPDESPDGTKVFQIVFGDENAKEAKHLLTANYEFRREFTQGAKPEWIITRIEHSKLL
ncbi:m-AAA protease-interacting protein 1, mitochondrial [Microcaecilia unicolor]|uniref:M-AAA protease-interacting protein 1, mitochondrial n=1 Tax=Microcaecilia unicolor TaxID=1415580 RepID=A0A6P7YRQ7_9AMPH|nr:m-AAA protease-interacting protein 1, mitochondrial [Microcaecilia unicolor]